MEVRWLRRLSPVWRMKVYVEELEEQFDELPEGYESVREEFEKHLKSYTTIHGVHIVIMLTFYASIVGSVTASIGFQINVFQQLYSVLGFTTVGLLYVISLYAKHLAEVDLENVRIRTISFLMRGENGK